MSLVWIGSFLVPVLSGFFFISLNYSRRLRYSRSTNSVYILALLAWGLAITAVALYVSGPVCEQLTNARNLLGFQTDHGFCADLQVLLPSTNLNGSNTVDTETRFIRIDSTALLALFVAIVLAVTLNFLTLIRRMLEGVKGLFDGVEFVGGLALGGLASGAAWAVGALYEHMEIALFASLVERVASAKLTIFCAVAALTFVRNPVKRAAKAKYILEYGNGSEFLLFKAATLDKLVQISLKSGKVYIGKPIDPISPRSVDPDFIKIVPYLSGYRTVEKKEVEIVTDYTRLAKSMDLAKLAGNEMMFTLTKKIPEEDLKLLPDAMRTSDKIDIADLMYALKMSEIESITIWDEKIYTLLNIQPSSSIGGTSHSPPPVRAKKGVLKPLNRKRGNLGRKVQN